MKSLVLYRKVYNTVHCCCLYTQVSDAKERIEQLCEAGNSPLGEDAIDKYIVCEIDGDWRDYPTDEITCLCKRYCEQMEAGND